MKKSDSTILKEQLTTEDIIAVVTKIIGEDPPLSITDTEVIFRTCCHNPVGTGSYKLYYYPENKNFYCYTQEGNIGDIYALVEHCGKAKDFYSAYESLSDFFEFKPQKKTFKRKATELTSDWLLLDKIEKYNSKAEIKRKENKFVQENLIEFFPNCVPKVWLDEGIDYDVMELFGIRMNVVDEAIILPHYDIDGRLVGIRQRNFHPFFLADGKKYMPSYISGIMYNHNLGINLYPLWITKDYIKETGTAIILEGEKSCMRLFGYGIKNTCAVCGDNLSQTQFDLLYNLGVREIVLALDNEMPDPGLVTQANLAYKNRLIKMVQKYTTLVDFSIMLDWKGLTPYKSSPCDCGFDTFNVLYKNRERISCK